MLTKPECENSIKIKIKSGIPESISILVCTISLILFFNLHLKRQFLNVHLCLPDFHTLKAKLKYIRQEKFYLVYNYKYLQ